MPGEVVYTPEPNTHILHLEWWQSGWADGDWKLAQAFPDTPEGLFEAKTAADVFAAEGVQVRVVRVPVGSNR